MLVGDETGNGGGICGAAGGRPKTASRSSSRVDNVLADEAAELVVEAIELPCPCRGLGEWL